MLLKHWRKVASSEAAWQKATSKLDEADTQALWRLRKKTSFLEEEKGGARRKLEAKVSEVSMDSLGFPRMTGQELASEEDSEKEEEEEDEEEGPEEKKAPSENLPGLCLKRDWREQAMKRPAASATPMKKPSTLS